MRDGPDRFSVYFAIETPLAGAFAGVPVPRKITADEYKVLQGIGSRGAEAMERQARYDRLYETLVANGAFGFENGLQERDFAKILVGPPPGGDGDPATLASRQAEYETTIEKQLKVLKNGHGKPLYAGLCGQQVPVGGKPVLQWRWFVPTPENLRGGVNK
jgi:hypothetical protein